MSPADESYSSDQQKRLAERIEESQAARAPRKSAVARIPRGASARPASRAERLPRRSRRGRPRGSALRDNLDPGIGNMAAGLVVAGLNALGVWLGATGRELRREVRRWRGHRVSEVERRRGRKY